MHAPPNLFELSECRALLDVCVDDFVGISPLTPYHVDPERPWPEIDQLTEVCADAGFVLNERLTSHPSFHDVPWLDPRLKRHVDALREPCGLAITACEAVGAAVAGAGRGVGDHGTIGPAHQRGHRGPHG